MSAPRHPSSKGAHVRFPVLYPLPFPSIVLLCSLLSASSLSLQGTPQVLWDLIPCSVGWIPPARFLIVVFGGLSWYGFFMIDEEDSSVPRVVNLYRILLGYHLEFRHSCSPMARRSRASRYSFMHLVNFELVKQVRVSYSRSAFIVLIPYSLWAALVLEPYSPRFH